MEDKTVWVIGAGASKGHTDGEFPNIKEFFKKARELEIITEKGDEQIRFNRLCYNVSEPSRQISDMIL